MSELALRGTVQADAVVPQHVRDSFIDPDALDLIEMGMPENTRLAYRQQLILFGDWCTAARRTASPVSEETMLSYLAHLKRLPLRGSVPRIDDDGHKVRFRPAPSTIWIWYSAVRFIHSMGSPPLPWECGKKLSLAIDGYQEEMRRLGWRPRSAPRAYPEDVRAMVRRCDRDTSTGKRDAAVLLCGWRLAARAADLAAYRWRDVSKTPYGLDWLLNKSKTLKAGQTRTTGVHSNEDVEGYNPEFDAVVAFMEWKEWCATHKEADPTWAVFRPLDKYGSKLRLSSRGPAYTMSSTSVSGIVTKYALLAGLDETYTMHSLRRGFASWLREQGWDDLTIARAYGWAPGGSINVYLEDAKRADPRAPGRGALL